MEQEARVPQVGDVVIYHDPVGNANQALVTAAWSPTCINVVFVSDNEEERDSYGRQIKRQTSLCHKSVQPAHGFYWRWPEEEPNTYTPPVSV